MKKNCFAICAAALSVASALYAGAAYKEVPFEQKIKHDDLTFAATFDKLSLDADFVKSPPKTRGVKDINLALRGAIGFDGKNAYIAEPGEFLRYNAFKNADPHKGSISFWVAGMDYAPKDKFTNGRKRGNILYAYLYFGDGKDNINFIFYECEGTLDVLWRSSAAKHLKGLYSYGICRTKLAAKQREFFQVVFTWDKNNIALYINGELRSKALLPPKYAMTTNLKIIEKDSYISIRPRMWDDFHKFATAIDDVKIYKRALNELEVKNEYFSLCKQVKGEVKKYSADFHGINTLDGKIDKLEAVFDCSGLNQAERKALFSGKTPLEYQLFNPDNKCIDKGRFDAKNVSFTHIFSNISKPGKYVLKTNFGKYRNDFTFVRPDSSFLNNKYGSEDTVPAIWKDFAVSGRKVTLWNRTYVFGNGPLPEKIYAYGKELLTKCPELKIDGKKINFTAGKTYRNNTSVTYTGTGKAKDFEIRYKTKVEFDGLIKLDFTVHGKPEIKNMALEWQVAPHASKYLMTPHLVRSGKASFVWPLSADNSQLWLTSEKQGGFCWSAENDANYRYKSNEKILFADAKTGKCKVNMITIPSKVPEGTPYTALFIATPTRPMAKAARLVGVGIGAENYPNTYKIFNTAITISAYKHVYGAHPGEYFSTWAKDFKKGLFSVYNTSGMSSTQHDLAVYLRKHTEVPNAYSYGGTYYRRNGNKYTVEKYSSITVCNKLFINDYIMDANMQMLKHPYGDRVGMFYYDIAGNNLCNNALHGCQFKDRFGRTVNTFVLLGKRDLHMRTLRLAHKHGRTMLLHAQRNFYPILNGMADYWHPGEEHCAILINKPHSMIDGTIDDIYYRTEYNRDVLGTYVSFAPAISQLNENNRKNPEYTIGLMTMLLLHHIDFSRMCANLQVMDKIYSIILNKYDLFSDKTVAHRFYEQKDIKTTNPKVEITWYECPAKRRLAVLGNRTPKAQEAVIDASALFGNADVKEEYYGKTYKFVNGKCKITVPARGFLMLELPNKK